METEVQSIDTNATAPAAPDTKWYVLRVVSGKEKKIKEYLDKDIVRNGWTGRLNLIVILSSLELTSLI